jgi:hypothetical protein
LSQALALLKVRPADSVTLDAAVEWPILAAAYARWRAEDLFRQIFPRFPNMGLWDFLDWMYSPGVEPVGIYTGEALTGVGWVFQWYEIEGKRVAEVGFAAFRGVPLSAWHAALDLLLRYAFEDCRFDSVYGLCWRENRAAQIITRRCRMTVVDRLPWGEEIPVDEVAYRLKREEWCDIQRMA